MEHAGCAYEGCQREQNERSEFCEFHAPLSEKELSSENFVHALHEEIKRQEDSQSNYSIDLSGFVLHGDLGFYRYFEKPVRFDKAVFHFMPDFSQAVFHQKARFVDTKFEIGASFAGTKFMGAGVSADFTFAEFEAVPYFSHAEFNGAAQFQNAKFSLGVDFQQAQFSDSAFFGATLIGGERADFSHVRCASGRMVFNHAYFFSSDTNFSSAEVDDLEFVDCQFGGVCRLVEVTFAAGGRFKFVSPQFLNERALVRFERIVFNPSLTFFEHIGEGALKYLRTPISAEGLRGAYIPALLFRHCQLRDVAFTSCHSGLISFVTSAFDQARFNAMTWMSYTKRFRIVLSRRKRNVLLEEFWFRARENELPDADRSRLVELKKDVGSELQIADMYRQLKTALDGAKDFTNAGEFYFNEYEMRWRWFRRNREWRNKLWQVAYSFYYMAAGYGERPLWSFGWFVVFTMVFAVLHMWHGFAITASNRIGYSFDFSCIGWRNISRLSFWGEWLGDLPSAMILALYRIIPTGYMPKDYLAFQPNVDAAGLLLIVLNSAVLLLFLTFIFIGLQRQFKRS